MKKPLILIALLLLLLVLASVTGGCDYITGAALVPSIVSPLTLPPYSDITPQQAYEFLMLSSVQTRVLDVRTPTEYIQGHILSAINIDFNVSNFKEQISLLDRNARYAVYCLSGVRSAMALISGIECASVTSSTSKGPSLKRESSFTTLMGICRSPPHSVSLDRSMPAVNGVA